MIQQEIIEEKRRRKAELGMGLTMNIQDRTLPLAQASHFDLRTERLMSRTFLAMGLLVLIATLGQLARAEGPDSTKFKRLWPVQYIAALGEPGATSGSGAQAWGLWRLDPGPRGVRLDRYDRLQAVGEAPARWKFDSTEWWLEEHGLIMEKPDFPVPPGKYLVTGGREVTTVLTIHPRGADGHQRWELAEGATLWDVTHLACRSARYTPARGKNSCSPANVRQVAFPVAPGATLPAVEGCNKQDYAVLIVIGVAED